MSFALPARTGAIAIAVAAAIDPSCTRNRERPVPVSLVYDAGAAEFAARVRRDAGNGFAVIDGAAPGSQATVLIRGTAGLPPAPETGPVFVIDDPSPGALRIASLDAPLVARRGRAVTVRVVIDAPAPAPASIKIELRAGTQLVASEERPASRSPLEAALRFVPASAGLLRLRVDVTAGSRAAHAESPLDVVDRRLRVLFVDPRPSWQSTFVRRALEEDPAFEISSSTTIARGVSAVAGTPRYESAALHDSIDVIVAGTPSALSAASLQSMESFARDRGGAVVLLADADASGALARLTGVDSWRARTSNTPAKAASGHGALMYSQALFPSSSRIPRLGLAHLEDGTSIVHEIPAGRGRMIVDSALDAWRYRSADGSDFGAFWRGVIGDAALAAAPPLSIVLTPASTAPGQNVTAEVAFRNARPADAITVEGTVGTTPVRFWPAPAPGVFTATFAAPIEEGTAPLKVTGTGAGATYAAEATLLTTGSAPVASRTAEWPSLLAASRGGAHIANGDIAALRSALRAAIPAHTEPVRTHPMRYAWWLVPFTLLLGYEWRWRRQRGLK